MSDLTNVPGLPPLTNPATPKRNLWKILTIAFGAAMVVFLILAIIGLVQAASSNKSNEAVKAEGYKEGQAAQAKADEEKIRSEKEIPFKSYTAPDSAGAFSFKYPKNWSLHVVEGSSAAPISLTMHPEMIKDTSGDDNYAMEIKLTSSSFDSQLKTYQSLVKSGKLKARDVVVSGIQANRFEGKIDGRREGVVVILPLRDKTLSFTNTDKAYITQFDQVLTTANIKP
jgi:hypothetical protein